MTVTVAQLISGARNLINDRLDDHFSRDDVSSQVSGSTSRFQLVNRNIVDLTTDLAPANPAFYWNDVLTVPTAINKATGVVTFATAPPAGTSVKAEYYFVLMSDLVYTEFAGDAANFVGVTLPTQIGDLLVDASHHYMAAKAADKMSSLSAWYYSANAGNKSFNKDSISAKFAELAKKNDADAIAHRDDVYKRWGKRNAPATALGVMPVSSYTPRR